MNHDKYSYSEVKQELLKLNCSTKHFTKAFYKMFGECVDTMKYNIKNGIDDSYIKNGMILFHAYDDIYRSKFYNLNSCAYCEMLSILC